MPLFCFIADEEWLSSRQGLKMVSGILMKFGICKLDSPDALLKVWKFFATKYLAQIQHETGLSRVLLDKDRKSSDCTAGAGDTSFCDTNSNTETSPTFGRFRY